MKSNDIENAKIYENDDHTLNILFFPPLFTFNIVWKGGYEKIYRENHKELEYTVK